MRRAKRDKRRTSLDFLQEKGIDFYTSQSGPESEIIRKEEGKAIQQSLLALSENDRTILLLSSQENMAYREIGQVLDISISAVKVRVHRARQRFAIARNKITILSKE